MTKTLTTIFIIYNEYQNVEIIYRQISKSQLVNHKYLIFDNGSTDERTKNFIKSINKSQVIDTLRVEDNLGFGGGVVFAAKKCDSEYIGWVPGNLKIRVNDLEEFISKLELSPNLFTKARRVGRKKYANFKTLVAGILQSLLSGYNLIDTGGTPTYCHSKFIKDIIDAPTDVTFETFALLIAKKKKLKINRPNIPYGERVFGNSHWQIGLISEVKLMLRLLNLIQSVKRNKHF